MVRGEHAQLPTFDEHIIIILNIFDVIELYRFCLK